MAFSIPSLAISWPLVAVCISLWLVREIWNLFYFKRNGVPGPRPLPLLGNITDFQEGFHQKLIDYGRRYGKICGIFAFRERMYVIYDLEMLKQVMIKSFNNFVNHKHSVLENKPFHKSITMLCDDQWKDVRNVITPTFSASKMKQMSSLMNECCDLLVNNLEEAKENDNRIECMELFGSFGMDSIAKCAFGLQVDSQHNADHPFVTNAKKIFTGARLSLRIILPNIFLPVAWIMNYLEIGMFPGDITNFFVEVVTKAMSQRKQSGDIKRQDFLQLLLNAEEDDETESKGAAEEADLHNLLDQHHDARIFDTKKRSKRMLTTDEIVGQALFFLLGGYNTTRLALSFAAYSLATNTDVQDRLIEEVDEVTPTRDSVSYSSVAKMPYLDRVVCETLRLYPPAPLTERECNETFTYGGVTIPKGASVLMPVFAIHRDPALWPEPDKFDPDRFTRKNRENRHPFAWVPFGAGPRHCIAMRFALMEIKMALVRALQKYRFEVGPETEFPIKLGRQQMDPDNGITLRVVGRE